MVKNNEHNRTIDHGGKVFLSILPFLAIGSRLPEVFLSLVGIPAPIWLGSAQLILIAGLGLSGCVMQTVRPYQNLAFFMAFVLLFQSIGRILSGTVFWHGLFRLDTFTGNFGSGITLKFLSAVAMAALLLLFLRSAEAAFLLPGDLRAKAGTIAWIGIRGGVIPWLRLAVVSGFLISFGTLLLTLVTVTGFRLPSGIVAWMGMIPLLLIFSAVNALSEGILYRNAVLGSLQGVLPDRWACVAAAIPFGLAHFEGAPGGLLGVVMSGLLGWYLCRSMTETRGFAAAWIIHFLQDFAILSTVFLLDGHVAG